MDTFLRLDFQPSKVKFECKGMKFCRRCQGRGYDSFDEQVSHYKEHCACRICYKMIFFSYYRRVYEEEKRKKDRKNYEYEQFLAHCYKCLLNTTSHRSWFKEFTFIREVGLLFFYICKKHGLNKDLKRKIWEEIKNPAKA